MPCAQTYNGHARATLAGAHVCVVLNPRREIKVFAEGAQVFSFSHADWRLLDQIVEVRACGRPPWAATRWPSGSSAARSICRTRARARCSSCCAGPCESLAQLVAATDRLDMELLGPASTPWAPSRRDLLHLLAGRTVTELDPSVLAALATMDGATVTDADGVAARRGRDSAPSADQ